MNCGFSESKTAGLDRGVFSQRVLNGNVRAKGGQVHREKGMDRPGFAGNRRKRLRGNRCGWIPRVRDLVPLRFIGYVCDRVVHDGRFERSLGSRKLDDHLGRRWLALVGHQQCQKDAVEPDR